MSEESTTLLGSGVPKGAPSGKNARARGVVWTAGSVGGLG